MGGTGGEDELLSLLCKICAQYMEVNLEVSVTWHGGRPASTQTECDKNTHTKGKKSPLKCVITN